MHEFEVDGEMHYGYWYKNEWLNRIAYNDNEIGKIYRDNDERILKTVNCRKIVHNVELVDEIILIK